ncbi:MAG: MBL fold metallo-hydrolase [Clostridiales bacterium]|jgi:glyoxylase-like metal-dependent hydrolase (beta-lactamase superfamily II)|nr:MBL fold metallo-hydrolase [Clostridiales bacterium]
MLTQLYPMVQFKKDTWEIDEFECASAFLLIGGERAMLIDCGIGIGDLRGAVGRITDKPLVVVVTHNHGDHTGNIRQFREIWMSPKDSAGAQMPWDVAQRRGYARMIAERQKGIYPYDPETDIREYGADEPMPVIHDVSDGQRFDLGGGRVVVAMECPGHTEGELVLLDEASRTLFCGDALNYNLLFGAPGSTSIERAVKGLEWMRDARGQYDGIFNGHHDFRPLGAPLADDCLPNAIELCHQLLDGTYSLAPTPDFLKPPLPPMTMVQKGRNYVGFDKDRIFE